MLINQFVCFAIEPVTTTLVLIGIGKTLGIFGAAAGGATLGNAASQKANGQKDVNWDKALSKGVKHGLSGISVGDQIKKSNQ